ncbi:MAG: peptide chain release factor 1 [Deltaproteobacteria bacterium]|nr:peptide chain release factor 1 [Deltaproteobacteria bacterium]
MKDRLKTVLDRYEHLTSELSNPDVIKDANQFRKLSQERAGLDKLVAFAQEYLSLSERKIESEELLKAGGEMAELAHEDLAEINQRFPELEKKILFELLPKDPHEGKDIFIEIRAGAGGDEASLFAADLFRMYSKFALKKKWRMEIMSESFSEKGGYKEVVGTISGADAYNTLKYESGVHRVQRVPTTEAMGRVHTSTVTVAIMPEAEENDLVINEKDLRIDVFRAGGKGGQGVNTTDSAVRVVHLPTNTVVVCQDERSQIKNKAKAMKVLRARILDAQALAQSTERAASRKAQVGTGDRSERIRTYNFPQERVTDHRIGLTLHRLSSVIEGDLDEIVEALQQEEYTRLLAEESKAG